MSTINEGLAKLVKNYKKLYEATEDFKFHDDIDDQGDVDFLDDEYNPVIEDKQIFDNNDDAYRLIKPFSASKADSQIWKAENLEDGDIVYFIININTSEVLSEPSEELDAVLAEFDNLTEEELTGNPDNLEINNIENTDEGISNSDFADKHEEGKETLTEDEPIDEPTTDIAVVDVEPEEIVEVGEDQEKSDLKKYAEDVMDAYQSANKWFDILKEYLFTDLGCVFFSSYIHNLAHTMPERFDKFGDILHTIDMKIPYPATQYIPNEPQDLDDVFNSVFETLDNIKHTLNAFIKFTDEEYHGMACAAEELLNDIESEYTPLYKMKKAWSQYNGDVVRFDKWVGQYCKERDNLNESLSEEIIKPRKRINPDYVEPAIMRCENCGTEFDLTDEYYGACQCPECGQWYNLFGQTLLPPDEWEEDLDESLNESLSVDIEKLIADIFSRNQGSPDDPSNVILDDYYDDYFNDGTQCYIVVCDNSNPTYLSWLKEDLINKLEPLGIGFESESNDNGLYGRTYIFYEYDDETETTDSLDEAVGKVAICGPDDIKDSDEKDNDTIEEDNDTIEEAFEDVYEEDPEFNADQYDWDWDKCKDCMHFYECDSQKYYKNCAENNFNDFFSASDLAEEEINKQNAINNPKSVLYDTDSYDYEAPYKEAALAEDTEKLADGKWANVGKDGKADSGKFKTKKAADAQRKAMYANGYGENLDEAAPVNTAQQSAQIQQQVNNINQLQQAVQQKPQQTPGQQLAQFQQYSKNQVQQKPQQTNVQPWAQSQQNFKTMNQVQQKPQQTNAAKKAEMDANPAQAIKL